MTLILKVLSEKSQTMMICQLFPNGKKFSHIHTHTHTQNMLERLNTGHSMGISAKVEQFGEF